MSSLDTSVSNRALSLFMGMSRDRTQRREREHCEGYRMAESRVTGHAQVSSGREIIEHRRHGHRERSFLSWQACPVIELDQVRESIARAVEWQRAESRDMFR